MVCDHGATARLRSMHEVSMRTTMRPVVTCVLVAAFGFLLTTTDPSGQAPSASPARTAGDPCAAPANKIIAENCKAGNPRTEWDINAAGDPSIQGFATAMSVNI